MCTHCMFFFLIAYDTFIVATQYNEIHGYSTNSNDYGEAMEYFGAQGSPSADVHVAVNVRDRCVFV